MLWVPKAQAFPAPPHSLLLRIVEDFCRDQMRGGVTGASRLSWPLGLPLLVSSKYFALRRDRLTEKARGDMKSYSKRNAVKLNRDQSHNRQEGEARNGHKTASIKGTLYEKIKQFPQISLDSLCGLHLSFCSEEGFDSAAPLPHGTQHCALHAGPQHLAAHSWTSQGTQGDLADLQPLLTHGTSDISLPMR
nr:uncharacterized protein LOC110365636 isoform X2 [Columba livia]